MAIPVVSRQRQRDPRVQWFWDARVGMFVHFGLYALLGRGEWAMYDERIPRDEYELLAKRFNPDRFAADEWVDVAERAGARYIAVTTKHHDGFCLFATRHTDYNITRTPFGRDLIGELVATCQKRGMKIVLYYSQPDWHHPNYVHRPQAIKDLQDPPETDRPDWRTFQRYVENQVFELVTKYGRIDGIWFDGSHRGEVDWRGRRLYRLIKRHQPHAVVNDRARFGDFFTPERSLPDDLGPFFFEACQSVMLRSWGYDPGSPLFSVPNLLENLVRVVCAGGNFLLNVGPAPDGAIPAEQRHRLEAVGDWVRKHAEAIYCTRSCHLQTGSPEILATQAGDRLYLHLLRWPQADTLIVPGIRTSPRVVALLGSDEIVTAHIGSDGLELRGLPAIPPRPGVNVVSLGFRAPPPLRLADRPRASVSQVNLDPSAENELRTETAEIVGYGVKGAKLRRRVTPDGRQCVSGWQDPNQYLRWVVSSPRPARLSIACRLSCPAPYPGSRFEVQVAGTGLRGHVLPTPSFDRFRLHELGTVDLPEGKSILTVKALYLSYGYLFADVAGVTLRPVK